MKKLIIASLAAASLLLTSCGGINSSEYVNVPAGYVAKILTPTGWQDKIIESGQLNLGGENMDGRANQAVFMEATAVQMKESFMASQGGEDHRIIVSNGADSTGPMPVAVDVYVRLRIPTDARLRNRVFAEITPSAGQGNARISWITVQSVYNRFVHQEARSIIRQVIGAYSDDRAINMNRAKIEADLTVALNERLRTLRVPLELQSVSLSNVTPDPIVQDNRNRQAGAAAEVASIDAVGTALARNPRYVELEQVRATERMVSNAVAAGKPPTLVIGIDGAGHAYAAQAR
ncbi:SPFH domain-containing protein [Patescibacteria group bacterium]|nr:SPFH domain-containing protein [Patescibacteria group bacterium]MBU2159007.1 SPFH domain-containing protein [Patescibacteria group bacterium]MBU2220329.1 SPFH domain-containing protein [Patescibacteria group bacterium]